MFETDVVQHQTLSVKYPRDACTYMWCSTFMYLALNKADTMLNFKGERSNGKVKIERMFGASARSPTSLTQSRDLFILELFNDAISWIIECLIERWLRTMNWRKTPVMTHNLHERTQNRCTKIMYDIQFPKQDSNLGRSFSWIQL